MDEKEATKVSAISIFKYQIAGSICVLLILLGRYDISNVNLKLAYPIMFFILGIIYHIYLNLSNRGILFEIRNVLKYFLKDTNNINYMSIYDKICLSTLVLSIIDIIIFFLLIHATDGLGNSNLEILLILIPTIIILSNISWWIPFMICIIYLFYYIASFVLYINWSYLIVNISLVVFFESINKPFQMYGIQIIGIFILLCEISSISFKPFNIKFDNNMFKYTSLNKINNTFLNNGIENWNDIFSKSINLAANRYKSTLKQLGIDRIHISLVHEINTYWEQSLILSLPILWIPDKKEYYYNKYYEERISAISYMTFMGHYIDDIVDNQEINLSPYMIKNKYLYQLCNIILENNQRKGLYRLYSSIENEVECIYKYKNKMLNCIIRFEPLRSFILTFNAFFKNRKLNAINTYKEDKLRLIFKNIRQGFSRIALAGFIQQINDDTKRNQIFNIYKELLLKEEFSDIIKDIYRSSNLLIWSSSKVVMEIWQIFEFKYNPNISEFYTILYSPILFYHNYRQEVQKEQYKKFIEIFGNPNEEFKKVLIELYKYLISEKGVIIRNDLYLRARLLQLRVLLHMYKNHIEDSYIIKIYEKYMEKFQNYAKPGEFYKYNK